jgi:hypothetical protein
MIDVLTGTSHIINFTGGGSLANNSLIVGNTLVLVRQTKYENFIIFVDLLSYEVVEIPAPFYKYKIEKLSDNEIIVLGTEVYVVSVVTAEARKLPFKYGQVIGHGRVLAFQEENKSVWKVNIMSESLISTLPQSFPNCIFPVIVNYQFDYLGQCELFLLATTRKPAYSFWKRVCNSTRKQCSGTTMFRTS